MENYPKFEKANEHTIRIVTEKKEEVTLTQLVSVKKQIEAKLAELQERLNNLNLIIDNANLLGIQEIPQPTIPPEKEQTNG